MMGLSEEIRRKLIATFQMEQREHLQTMTQGLLALEREPSNPQRQATLEEIFRAAHSVKGSARAVNMTGIESVGHALEEVLMRVRDGRLSFSSDTFDILYQAMDAIELLLAQVETGQSALPANALALLARLEALAQDEPLTDEDTKPSPANHPAEQPVTTLPAEQRPPTPSSEPPITHPVAPFMVMSEETIRVAVSKLDALMAQLSELLAAKIRAEQRLAEARQLRDFATEWQKEWLTLRGQYHRLLRADPAGANSRSHPPHGKDMAAVLEFVNHNQEQLRHFTAVANTLYRQFASDFMRLSLIINELEEEMKRVRMLPLATITTPFHRMVRDLARQQGKQISLVIRGDETELDRRLLEQVKDPLVHLLRNAVDHGIEPMTVRQQTGKKAQATITLTAGQQANNIVMTVSDDGAGLNLKALRQTAVGQGILSQTEADALHDADAANLVFRSGLSTSQRVSHISGRGVGLDVVRQNVADLHGSLSVDSSPGRGTTFTMVLPLTLASSRGLLLTAAGQTFALPLTTVERMILVRQADVTVIDGKEAILDQGQLVALVRLASLLELPVETAAEGAAAAEAEPNIVIIISVAGKRLGLMVDNLVGEQEIVIKNLGKQLVKVGGFMGATMLGSGQIILVLHAADLLKLAVWPQTRRASPVKRPSVKPVRPKTVLVVDDSITTRTLEKNILEARGYQVKLATNGEEALSVLVSDSRLPDLIVTDVNMPRLNGFDLTQRLKRDGRTKDIPVILVTSLDSPADKARGIEVGADAYIVKSRFDQGNLLAMIEQLTL